MFYRILPYFLILSVFTVGCSTVPPEAPQELHDAFTAIERNDKNNVKEYLPRSSKRSKENLSKAVGLWKKAQVEVGVDSGMYELEAAELGRESKELALKLNDLHQQLKIMDSDEERLDEGLAKIEGLVEPPIVVEQIVEEPRVVGKEVVSTLAHFRFDDASSPIIDTQEFEALTALLNEDRSTQATLIGYADHRGREGYNEQLARQRSLAVKELMIQRGVNPEQLVVISKGSQLAQKSVETPAQLQLDRKVQAKVLL